MVFSYWHVGLFCNVPDGAAWYQIGWGFHGSPHQFHQPVVITLLAGFILKESLTVIKRVCLFLALLGTFIITQGASGSGEIMGILFMIISVLSFGFASIQMRRLTQKYAPS